ncbi:MAG: hypothetical protein ACQESF_04865 [Nanobdellota archaeon]
MGKLKWCSLQAKGLKIIEPNERLSVDYIKEADVDLNDMKKSSLKWKNIMGYYACYNALYAVIQKIGIKCEIHDCTIELMNLLGLAEYKDFLTTLKEVRIGVQYYLKKPKPIDEKKVTDFVLECKVNLDFLSQKKIDEIRDEISKAIS